CGSGAAYRDCHGTEQI
ncbi:SEC-C metal-binding domain-containing protein, partial [Streptomyces lunaelactis]